MLAMKNVSSSRGKVSSRRNIIQPAVNKFDTRVQVGNVVDAVMVRGLTVIFIVCKLAGLRWTSAYCTSCWKQDNKL